MKIKQFAKAIMPSVVSLLTAVGYSLSQGTVDRQTIIIAAVGFAGSIVTYFVPNAAPEVQAVEAVFSPIAAGAPDPEPAPSVPVAAPAAPTAPPTPPVAS